VNRPINSTSAMAQQPIAMKVVLALLALALAFSEDANTRAGNQSVRSNEISTVAREIMKMDWRSVNLAVAVDTFQVPRAERELSAPVTHGYACSSLRVIRFLETVEAGECLRCMGLEFHQPTDQTSGFALTALKLDYTSAEYEATKMLVEELLQNAGVPKTVIDIPRRRGRAEWSGSWTQRNEFRSLEVTIERDRRAWRVHFEHYRWPADGVPESPP
jgi:hypothetical protein